MTQRLLFAFFALSLIITSCGSSDDLDGDWTKNTTSTYKGSPRGGAVSFVIGNFAYVGTGFDGDDCLNEFYKFSIATMNWEKISDFPGVARQEAVAFTATVNGQEKAYVGTGLDDNGDRLSDFYEFDPATDTWNPTAIEFPGGKRQGAISFSINGIGYVGTGYGFRDGKDRNYLNDLYKFENGVWSSDIGFPGEKSASAATFVINNKAYVVSGTTGGRRIEDVWEYDPAKGWTPKRDLDDDNRWEDVQRAEAVAFVIDNKGYIATGKNGNYTSEVWEYNPTNDDWKEKTSLEREVSQREDAVAFTLNNRGFIATGNVGGGYLDDMWEFKPFQDENEDNN